MKPEKWRLTFFITHSISSPHISEAQVYRLGQWNEAKVGLPSRNKASIDDPSHYQS